MALSQTYLKVGNYSSADVSDLLVPNSTFTRGRLYQCGNGSRGSSQSYYYTLYISSGLEPVYVDSDSKFVTSDDWVSVEDRFTGTVALKTDGTLWMWGISTNGSIPLNLPDYTDVSVATQIPHPTGAKWIQASMGTQLNGGAVDSNGDMWMWGYNSNNMMGQGYTLNAVYSTAQKVATFSAWRQIAIGSYSVSAIAADGSLWSCGQNNIGQLGDGTTIERSSWVQIGTEKTWRKVVCNGGGLAIKQDGTLWGWGSNNNGQLAQYDTVNRSSPVQIFYSWRDVAYYGGKVHAIRYDGTLWSWGYNIYGNLGLGDNAYRSEPVQVGLGTDWRQVSAGWTHTAAIKQDGTLWTWGDNGYGQLGNVENVGFSRSSPVQVGGNLENWTFVNAGYMTTNAIRDTQVENSNSYANVLIFNTPGTYTWSVPPDIYQIGIVAAAGGGSGGNGWCCDTSCSGGGGGGGGGGAAFVGNGYVYPGQILEITVGSGGAAATGSSQSGNAGTFTRISDPGGVNNGSYAYIYLNPGAGGSGAGNGQAGGNGGAGGTVGTTGGVNGTGYAGGNGGQANPNGGCVSGTNGAATNLAKGGEGARTSSYAGGGGGGGASVGRGGRGGRRNTPGGAQSSGAGYRGGGSGGTGDEWTGERQAPGGDGFVRINW